MAGQDFSHQNPYNMGISPGPNTGNMIIDTGANIVRNYAWNKAGGQGPVQYLPPNQPGMNPLFQAAYLNQISPRQQELRQAYLSAFNPAGRYATSALKNWGYKDESAALEQAMQDGSVGQVLSQMGNQNPAVTKHLLGGDMFGAYDRMLANAGAFNKSNIRNAGDFTRSADAALSHAHKLAGRLTERMYRGKNGQFSPVPNADQTGGFAPDQAMDVLNLMAQQGVYGRSSEIDKKTGEQRYVYMGSTNDADIDKKMGMHKVTMQALAKVARTTGSNDPMQAYQDIQRYAGKGGTRNIDSMVQISKEMENMRAMSMVANNQNMQPSFLLNTAMEGQFAISAEMGGQMRDSAYVRSQGLRVSEDVATIVTAKQNERGAPLSKVEIDDIRDQQIKRRRAKMHSTAHRALMVAGAAAARSPKAAAYMEELKNAKTPGEQKKLLEQISIAAFGNKQTLFNTANNETVMADFMTETESIMRDKPGGETALAKMYEEVDRMSETGEHAERGIRRQQLASASKIKGMSRLLRESGNKMDRDKLAKARGDAIINALDKETDLSDERIAELKDTFGKGSARDLRALKQFIKNSPDMSKHSDLIKTKEMEGAVGAYRDELEKVDPKTSYPRSWQKQQRGRLNAMMNSSNRTDEQKASLKAKLKEIDKLPPSERGKAMADFIQSDEYIDMGGTKERQESEMRRLESSRKRMGQHGAGEGLLEDPAEKIRKLGKFDLRESHRDSSKYAKPSDKYGAPGQKGFVDVVGEAKESLSKADAKAQKQSSYAQRMLKLVQSGEQSMTDAEALMEASGMDPSVLKQMQADATKKDVEKSRKETNAANTMNEVVIKDGTKLVIIENGQQRTAKVVQ